MSNKEYESVIRMVPIVTINLIILRRLKKQWQVLLLIRKTGYAKGQWCVIGGRVWLGETVEKAIDRHALDLDIKVRIIPPFNPNFPCFVDDSVEQDETKHPFSLVYPAEIVSGEVREEGEEYKGYRWFFINNLPRIAYGQKLQIQKAIEELKNYKASA